MSDIAIKVENLSKLYRIGSSQEPYKSLRDSLTNAITRPSRRSHAHDTVWALKDISLEVKRGEVVGIIGRNGAGKSTLLKILSRITEPTEGRAEIHGRVGSLLEVGTGFHPELTGRENIYLNAAILGMKKVEIERKFDEIVAFAEIDKFIDTPVKHYSSGMYVRLAFTVAAHLDPEVLVVDEVLAVGDAAFQRKCLGKISHISTEGRTVLLVSHIMPSILRLCSRVVWLEEGRTKMDGKASAVVENYLLSGLGMSLHEKHWQPRADNHSIFAPLALRVFNHHGKLTNCVKASEGFYVEFEYQFKKMFLLSSEQEFIFQVHREI